MAFEYYLGPAGSELKLSRIGLVVTPNEEIIGRETRLASGTLVRDVVANKKKWAFAYQGLPGLDANVEDGGIGRDRLRWLYEEGGTQRLMAATESGPYEVYEVMFEMRTFRDQRIRVEPFWVWEVRFALVEV